MIVILLGNKLVRLNCPCSGLQHPIPTLRLCSSQIHRSRHIRSGCCRKLPDKRLSLFPLSHIATIQQQVAGLSQRIADAGKCRAMIVERSLCDHAVAQLQAARRSMRNNVDGVQTGVPCQTVRHLLKTILASIKPVINRIRRQVRHHDIAVRHGGVDKEYLLDTR